MDENEKLWSVFGKPATATTGSDAPSVTKESLDKVFNLLQEHQAETDAARHKPIRFKKDGPLIYPSESILLISEKFRDTKVGNALTWLAWFKIWWLKAPLDTGDIYAVNAKMMDPFEYAKRHNLPWWPWGPWKRSDYKTCLTP